jgi:hypothetical protein
MTDDLTALVEGVMARAPLGSRALTELEWDPNVDLDDADSRDAFAALFRGQGRTLATTPALGALVARQLLDADEAPAFSTVAAFRAEREQTDLVVVSGEPGLGSRRIVVDLGDDSLLLGPYPETRGGGAQPLDRSTAIRWRGPIAAFTVVPVEDLARRRQRALELARLAIAHEMLGVVEHLMVIAVEYAHDRSQFGTPIGSNQAIQQLLAAAQVEVVGLRNACEAVGGSPRRGEVSARYHHVAALKALAGRTARRVAQTTLQTFGAIGFTWEHEHHRYARRALTLDALYGSYDELVVELGLAAMDSRLPRIPVF